VVVSVGMSLVINTTFPFDRIASVYAGPKEIKSSGSSSKSNRLLLEWLFQNGGASISSPTPTRRAENEKEVCAELDKSIPLPSRDLH
jgi:hypothetical protein